MTHNLVNYLAQNLCYETQGEEDHEELEYHLFPLAFLKEDAAGGKNCAYDCERNSVSAQWIGYHRQKPGRPRFIEVTEQGKCYEYDGKNDANYCASFHLGATSISGNHKSILGYPAQYYLPYTIIPAGMLRQQKIRHPE